jgi:hypothetical protein
MLQPTKVATPATAFAGFVGQVRTAPAGVVMLRVTAAVPLETVLPPESWTATTGWVPKAVPPLELEGFAVKPSLVADPTVMVRLALTALVSPLAVAVSVYVPALSMRQPAKVATPEEAALGLLVQLRMAPAAVVMLRLTELVPAVVLPPESWIATTGWLANAIPPVELDGLVVKASLVADPTVMVKLALTALVSPVAVAVSVYVPVLSILQPENLATPEEVFAGLAEQARVAPPVGGVMVRVTEVTVLVTVLPAASCMATLGDVLKVVLTAVLGGDRVKASLTAPEEMVKLELTALVSTPEVAVRV